VGRVEPVMSIETVPLSPYHSKQVLKWVLEFMFVAYLCHTTFDLFKKIRAHKSEQQPSPASNFETTSMSWKTAVYGLFVSSNEPVSKIVDLVNVSIGVAICILWANLVFDADTWSGYHRDIIHIEHLVEGIIHNMVSILTCECY